MTTPETAAGEPLSGLDELITAGFVRLAGAGPGRDSSEEPACGVEPAALDV
jgi:hypothetical protein